MKITFPNHRRKKGVVRGGGFDALYVVICRFKTPRNHWGFADFWDKPYTHKCYRDALKLKKSLQIQHNKFGWDKNCLAIMKVAF